MLTPVAEGFSYGFSAMASPCVMLIDSHDAMLAGRLGTMAEAEAARI